MSQTVHQAFPSLKAAAESKDFEGVSKVTSFAVAPHLIEVEEGFNARPLNAEHVESLALAYMSGATFPDLDVRVDAGRILLVDGHHRRAAALLAIEKGAEVRALGCKQFRGNDADRVAHMITSAGGLPLTPLQLGQQYRKLLGFGWSEKQIAARAGKSEAHVKQCLALTEANTDVQRAVERGEVSATTALQVVRQHGSKAGQVIAGKVAEQKAAGKAGRVSASAIQAKPKLSDVLALLREIPSGYRGEWADRVRAVVGVKGGAA